MIESPAETRVTSTGAASRDLAVSHIESRAAFLPLEEEWNRLVEECHAGPFNRHQSIRIWLDSFAPSAKFVILIARDATGALVAALPLLPEKGRVCGLPARLLVAAANTHSCRFDMVARDPLAASRAFLAHLLVRRDWQVLRITDVPEGGSAWQLHKAAIELGLPVGAWESQRSPYLEFPKSYEALLADKSPQFRANLRRRRRQLERRGELTFERVTGGAELVERLDEGFDLERRGWKGTQGTAIAQHKATRAFYGEFAKDAASRGELCLSFLRLDGRAIAFHYGFVHDGIYYVPKLSYDESLQRCSPGLVLLEEAVRRGIEEGLRGYDFLGAESDWKTKWSSSVTPHHWLFIFRDSGVGHALRSAKFEWAPFARRALSGVEKLWGLA